MIWSRSNFVQSEIEKLQQSLAELEAQSQRMDTYINQLNADLQEQQVVIVLVWNDDDIVIAPSHFTRVYAERSNVSTKGICDRWRYSRDSKLPRSGLYLIGVRYDVHWSDWWNSFTVRWVSQVLSCEPLCGMQTLIAIKAPSGTTLAVPYPDESVPPNRRKYQIFLKSNDGPVDIYLVNSPHVRSYLVWWTNFYCSMITECVQDEEEQSVGEGAEERNDDEEDYTVRGC